MQKFSTNLFLEINNLEFVFVVGVFLAVVVVGFVLLAVVVVVVVAVVVVVVVQRDLDVLNPSRTNPFTQTLTQIEFTRGVKKSADFLPH